MYRKPVGSRPLYVLPGARGLVERGNLDLTARPVVRNPGGSISTVRTISFDVGGREVLLPTVIGNRVVLPRAAFQHYRKTGQHLGSFRSVRAANAYAELLHRQQASLYGS